MKPKSLAIRSDLIFDRFSGKVIDRGDYLVVETPSRPHYYWGNHLIMANPPESGDLEKWIGLFEREIGPKEERGFMAITWDSPDSDQGEIDQFKDYGFSVQESSLLVADSISKSLRFKSDLIIRPYRSDKDWAQFVDIHFDPDWDYGSADSQRSFLKDKRDCLRAMMDAGLGIRFGAEVDGRFVGDAGVYWDNGMGRFNNVATHRDYRRRGVCSTLVYCLAEFAMVTKGLGVLVMEADENYHAAGIYESIGFVPTEKAIQLEWCAKS